MKLRALPVWLGFLLAAAVMTLNLLLLVRLLQTHPITGLTLCVVEIAAGALFLWAVSRPE